MQATSSCLLGPFSHLSALALNIGVMPAARSFAWSVERLTTLFFLPEITSQDVLANQVLNMLKIGAVSPITLVVLATLSCLGSLFRVLSTVILDLIIQQVMGPVVLSLHSASCTSPSLPAAHRWWEEVSLWEHRINSTCGSTVFLIHTSKVYLW